MFRKLTGLIIACCSIPALACVPAMNPLSPLSHYDKTQITNFLELEQPQLKGLNNARFIEATGFFTSERAKIIFNPHGKTVEGAELFYEISCALNKEIVDWQCELPKENRGGYYAETDDFYLLAENVKASNAEKMAQLLHDELVFNNLGHFRYNYGDPEGSEERSRNALDIVEIRPANQQGRFQIELKPAFGCTVNTVEVKEHSCSESGDCDYSITSSTGFHFL